MDKIKKIILNQWFISVSALLLLSLIIWFAGPYVGIVEYSNRFIVITVILLVFFSIKLFQYHQKKRQQKQMLKDLSDESAIDDMINAESKELKRKFDQAFNLLKASKGGESSLTDLPWYMIIGSPGSGKTTLLSNSGLKFPLFSEFSNQAIQGVGGTKNCDWWITQEAVLLDTAGRYTSRDSHQKADESGWDNFLSLIKKYRKKPISGLLVSFSLSDLLTMNEYELTQHVLQIKQRIAEINDFFSTRFPIYVVITKTDMLAGFSQFYDTFSHQEREQTFGLTFENQESLSGNVSASFSHKFKALVQSITRRQWQRISLERDASRKSLIYSFSDQFSSLKPMLIQVIDSLCNEDDKLSTGIIRGVYFTSGTQHGAPIDRMMAKVSQTFGLKNTAQVLWNNDQRSYFIKELLQQVVFPESDQFGVLAGYEKKRTLLKKASIAGAAVLTVCLCLGWFLSYSNNVDYIELSDQGVERWREQYQQTENNGDISQYIPALNDFSSHVALLKEQDAKSFSGLGLAQASNLEESFAASYQRLLKTVLAPFIKTAIENTLQQTDDNNERYQALKAYLMLSSVENRDIQFLKKWLKNDLKSNLRLNDADMIYITAHSEKLVESGLTLGPVNSDLVEDARTNLRSASLAAIYYQQLKQGYIDNPKLNLSMAQVAGADWRLVFQSGSDDIKTISRLFTPEYFKRLTEVDLPAFMIKLKADSWLLGDNAYVDIEALSRQIKRDYSRDYVRTWQSLLNSVVVKPLENLSALETALMATGAIDSPLMLLLDSTSKATMLTGNSSLSKATAFTEDKVSLELGDSFSPDLRRNDSAEVYITTSFSKLHELMKKERKGIVEQRLSSIIAELSMSVAQENNAYGQSGANTNKADSVKALQSFAYTQPQPLNGWLNQLSNKVLQIQHRVRKVQIAKAWKDDIVEQCNSVISYKYPFVKNAKSDASLQELSLLFAQNGILNQFFETHLSSLVNNKSYPWRWKTDVIENYGFDDNVLAYFERLNLIQKHLFDQQGNTLALGLSFKPIYLDSRLAKFTMSIYGKNMSYQFGRPISTRITWPPANPDAGSQYSFVRRDGTEVMARENGLFSLFRLLDSAKIKRINVNKVQITLSKSNFTTEYELLGNERADPLIISQLSRFKCLTQL